jgi:alpha-N-arabinofuranosidase
MNVFFVIGPVIAAITGSPAAAESRISVMPGKVYGEINRRIYGQFLEHIYHSVEDGLFGELVRNRAFAANAGLTRTGDTVLLTSPATDIKAVFGDPRWTDYELRLSARKTSGAEGFLILIRASDDRNFYWWNLGGWGNSAHQLEVERDDNRRPIGPRVSGKIEAGKWYDIRMRAAGDHIEGWLDDEKVLDMRDATHRSGGIGVGFWATCGEYKDFRVTDLSDSALPVDLGTMPSEFALPPEWRAWPKGSPSARLMKEPASPNTGLAARVDLGPGPAASGIAQERVNAVKGRKYVGSVWARAEGEVNGLTVALMGTSGEVLAKQALKAPGPAFVEAKFRLSPVRTDPEATLTVTASGSGTLIVDMVSMMRDDSIATGCRTDLLDAVKGLKPPIIRWPGGCFASIYRWKRAIGPQWERKPFNNHVWGEWDSCGFGIDEYMRLCRVTGAEPMVVVNLGSWDDAAKEEEYIAEALEWIEYCNGDATTPMGAKRAANGHPEPYNVVHWEMDNETWGLGVERYGKLVARVVERIRARWPGLLIHACTFYEKEDVRLLELCGKQIDFISYHFYEDPNRYATAPAHFEGIWKRYADMIARSPNPKVRISVTEWNAQSTDWRTGLFAGGYLNVMERSADVVQIATPALFLRRVDAPAWDNAFINHDHLSWFPAPNYVVMKLYYDHFQPLRIGCDAPEGLNVSATRSADGTRVVVKVVNAGEQTSAASIEMDDSYAARSAQAWRVEAALDDRNTLRTPARIAPQVLKVSVSRNSLRMDFPPRSVTVIEVRGRLTQ